MKTKLTLLLLIISLFAKAQQVNTVEYFFDTDSGFGNGMHININAASIDSTFDFNTGNLTAGLHSLVVRLKNSADKWSTIYQSNISINNGTAGPVVITAIEYFFDTDPGFGNGTQVNVNAASLDTDLSFNTGNLSQGVHTLFIRLKNSANVWSTVYQNSILINNGIAGLSVITMAEYYFDTDPGIGNGNLINLNSAAIDSTLKFNTTGLSAGSHTIFIRLKNSNNNWSFAYLGNFNVFNGIDSVPQIQSLEYFVDSVHGINAGTIQLNKRTSIDTTLSIHVNDNGTDKRVLGLRLKNQSGQQGNATLTDVSLCDLYKPKAGFRSVQYANTFTLIDTSKYNFSKKIKWFADGVLFDSSYTTNYIFPRDFIGTKAIKEVTGTGCRMDSVQHNIFIAGVEQYTGSLGSYGSDVEMNIYGGGMDTTLNVYLQKGDTIVYPYLKVAIDGKRLLVVFDFHKYQKLLVPGAVAYQSDFYTLHVVFPNNYHYTGPRTIQLIKSEPLTGCNGGGAQEARCPPRLTGNGEAEPYFQATLVGNTELRTGVWTSFSLNVTNTGTVVAKSVPVYMLIPAQYNVDTTKWFILNDNPHLRDSISIVTPIDTTIGGLHLQLNLYALIIPQLAPGETFNLPFRVLTSQGGSGKIMYWADKRMFGSPFKAFWGPCADAVFNVVAGFIPVVGCINGLFDFTLGAAAYVTNFSGAHRPSTGSMVVSAAGTLLSCATGPFSAVTKGSFSMVKDIAEVAEKGGNTLKIYIADKIAGGIGYSSGGESDPCSAKAQQEWEEQDWLARFGFDPNHISGNNQYDTIKHWINNYSTQKYYVSFENKATATANAQHVLVTDTLNAANFIWSTFSMNHFTIGDSSYLLPPFRFNVTQDVVLKHDNTMKVRFTANFDTTKGILTTDFFSIDTSGHVLRLDSLAGFLPPNTDGENGTGGFQFEIAARDKNTLDTFANKATIYFDNNPAIATNTWLNTIDITSPQGKIIKTIPVNDTTVKLVIQQSDIGSGVKFNTLYLKTGNDTLFRDAGIVIGDTVLFTGRLNQSYQLFTKATDHVGNKQYKDSVADISVTFPQGYVSSPTDYFRSVTSGDWNNIATWQSSPDNITYSPATLTPDSSANIITVRNGHTVTVTANVIIDQTIVNSLGALVVTGSTLTVTNNGLKLQSDSSGTARIGNSSGTISGNVILERYIRANNKRAWRLLSIPDVTNQTINAAWQNGQAKSITGLAGIGTMITSNNNASSFDFQTPGNSMLTYNSTADIWSGISATTLPIATDNAYFLFVRGDRTATPLNNLITATTLSTIGTLKQGNYPASPMVVQASKFASLGNPYASQIDFRNVTKTSGIDNTFYVWDPKLTGSLGVGGYQTLTYNGSNYVITPGGGSYGASGSVMNTIESGQGFLVHASNTGNVSFSESAKTAGSNMVFRTTSTPVESFITNIYSVETAGNSLEDGTMNLFGNYSNAVDGNDALKLINFGLNLSIVKENNFLTVEKRHPLTAADTIYFSLKNTKQQTYRFEFIANGLDHPGLSAWLIDNYLNTSTSVDLNGTTSVTFTVTADAASAAANRFVIIFSKPSSLLVYGKSSIAVYPNPVQNGFIKLQLINMPKGNYSVRLVNDLGQSVLSRQINHAEGTSTESIEVSKIKGIYMLELMKPDNNKIITKVIVN